MKLSLLTIDSYILEYHKNSGYEVVTIQATKYNEETGKPILWSIKSWPNSSMSKKDGSFQVEPMNSSKTEKFFKEYRFKTPDEALKSWEKFKHLHEGRVNDFFYKELEKEKTLSEADKFWAGEAGKERNSNKKTKK